MIDYASLGLVLAPGLALLIDFAAGDPQWVPHPVIMIGRLIGSLEKYLRRWSVSVKYEKILGCFLALITVGAVLAISAAAVWLAWRMAPWLGLMVNLGLIWTSLAAKSLAQAAREVAEPLEKYRRGGREEDLKRARRALGRIVGRDVDNLPPEDVARGAVETVAENSSDGIVAPLFYAFLGGAPLAMAYKAVNTLDSMVGYRNERYLHFGWASARLDDLANWIPARLTALLMVVAAALFGRFGGLNLDFGRAWRCLLRDGGNHPSPNSGRPEAAAAGALGVRLGGINRYQGQVSRRPHLGDPVRGLGPESVRRMIWLMFATACLAGAVGTAVSLIFGL